MELKVVWNSVRSPSGTSPPRISEYLPPLRVNGHPQTIIALQWSSIPLVASHLRPESNIMQMVACEYSCLLSLLASRETHKESDEGRVYLQTI